MPPETENTNIENLPVVEAGSGGTAPERGAESGGSWSGPSQEEWTAIQEQNKRLADTIEGLTEAFGSVVEPPAPRGEGFDLSQIDMTDPYQAAWLMDQIAAERMGAIAPYVKNAAQDQGQKQMETLLNQHETALKKDFPAGFDRKLAERAAFAFFDETGDAQGSVAAAARYAAEVRQQERNAAIEEYRTKNRRGAAFSDPDARSAGVKAPEPLKSFDEVLDKWTSQTEV